MNQSIVSVHEAQGKFKELISYAAAQLDHTDMAANQLREFLQRTFAGILGGACYGLVTIIDFLFAAQDAAHTSVELDVVMGFIGGIEDVLIGEK
jgi:hypothetical protein